MRRRDGWFGKLMRILRPRWSTLILAAVLFYAAHWYQAVTWDTVDYWARGVPWRFHEAWGPCPPEGVCQSYDSLALFADMSFWYLAAGLLRKLWIVGGKWVRG